MFLLVCKIAPNLGGDNRYVDGGGSGGGYHLGTSTKPIPIRNTVTGQLIKVNHYKIIITNLIK